MKKILTSLIMFSFLALVLPLAVQARETKDSDILQVVISFKGKPRIENIYKTSGILNDFRNQPREGYSLVLTNSQGKEIFKYLFQNTTFTRYTLNLPFLGATSVSLYDQSGQQLNAKQIDINNLKTPEAAQKPTAPVKKETIIDKTKNFFQGISDFIYGRKNTNKPNASTQTPELGNLSNYQAGVAPNNDFNKIVSKLPFETDFMKVIYVPVGKYINVVITQKPFSQKRDKALQYFKDQGIKNLCNLNLMITPQNNQIESYKNIAEIDLFAPGCKPLFRN